MKVGIIQKILGCILALLLVLGIVPVGLFYFATPVIAEDSIIRLTPTDETFVYSDAKNKDRRRLDEDNLVVGNYWNTYLKFDLSSLGNVKRADLRQAKLRLAVVDNGKSSQGENDCSFNVSYIDNDNWDDSMTWASKPKGEEQYLCTASGADGGCFLEIDLTEFVKRTAGYEDKVITLKLSPTISNSIPIRIASSDSDDPVLRPYLKIIVGDIYDSDPTTPEKSHLDTNGYVSSAYPNIKSDELLKINNGILAVDNGSAAYLKFNLDLRNIIGAVDNAEIFIRPVNKSANIKLNVYYLENDDWSGADLSYDSRPEGEQTLVKSYNGIDVLGGIRIDVTDIVYEAVSAGKARVSFIIDGMETSGNSTDSLELYSNYFEGNSLENNALKDNAPKLLISSTDDKEVVALREAISNLKGDNISFDNVTSDLPSSYTASNGEKVNIKWNINESFSIKDLFGLRKSVITNSGRINPPSLLEGAKTVRAKATLTCGSRTTEKYLDVTVPPDFGVPGRLQPIYDALW